MGNADDWRILSKMKRLPQFEELGERKVILKLMVLLYNYQTSQLGINQIMSSFCEKTGYFVHTGINNGANGLL